MLERLDNLIESFNMEKPAKKKSYSEAQAQSPVTFEAFYDLVEENVKADLVDGMIVRDSPSIPRHAQIVTWLIRLLGNYTEQLGLGEILCAPTTVRLSQYHAPEPDVFFISKARHHIIGAKYIDGAPDLCIEVVSRTSRSLDLGRKFELYAEYGVREYWIIDPISKTMDLFFNQESVFAKINPDQQGRLHSQVLTGLWLKPIWLLKEPQAKVAKVLQQILPSQAW